MFQADSHRPFTAEARVHFVVGPCGIYGGQVCTRTGFSPSLPVFSLNIIPPVLHAHLFIHHQTCTIAAVGSTGEMPPSVYPSKECSLYNISLHPRLRSLYRSLTPRVTTLKKYGIFIRYRCIHYSIWGFHSCEVHAIFFCFMTPCTLLVA